MPVTYNTISTSTLGTASPTIDITGIPNTYTDLKLVIVLASQSSASFLRMRVNSDTGGNYYGIGYYGSRTSVFSTGLIANADRININDTSATFPSLAILDFISYTSSNTKNIIGFASSDFASTSGVLYNYGFTYKGASAISSINLWTTAGNFGIGSTVSLYGILRA